MSKVLIFLAISMALVMEINAKSYIISKDVQNPEASASQAPYLALINVKHPHEKTFQPICTGAIITELDILTTAACASVCNITKDCQIYIGRTEIDAGGQQIKIDETIWHESYFSVYMLRLITHGLYAVVDLGFIHMEKISMSDTIQPLNIPGRELKDENKVIVAGWGQRERLVVNCFYVILFHVIEHLNDQDFFPYFFVSIPVPIRSIPDTADTNHSHQL